MHQVRVAGAGAKAGARAGAGEGVGAGARAGAEVGAGKGARAGVALSKALDIIYIIYIYIGLDPLTREGALNFESEPIPGHAGN